MYNDSTNVSYIKILSLLMGLFLSLNTIMAYMFPSEEGGVDTGGVLGLSFVGCVMLIIVFSVFAKTFTIGSISRYLWILVIWLIAFYEITNNFIGVPRTPFRIFVIFTIIGMLLPSLTQVDVRLFLRSIMFFSVPAFFRIREVFLPMIYADDVITMGYSYSFLTPVIASITYMFFFIKTDKGLWRFACIAAFLINMVFLYFLVAFGSRGPVVAILALLCAIYIIRPNYNMNGLIFAKRRLLVLSLGLAFLLTLFIPILIFIQSLLGGFGVSLNFIDRFIRLNESDKITSGRDVIYDATLDAFKENPLFGYGCDQFYNNTGISYPHNFILQILYDGGIVLALVLLVPVLYNLYKWAKQCHYEEYIVVLMLFFASVPGSLLSGDLWHSSTLWVFFGALFSTRFVKPNR